jgi:hypothetical protein
MANVTPADTSEAAVRTAIETTALDGDTVTLRPGTSFLSGGPLHITNKGIRITSLTGSFRDTILSATSGAVPLFQIANTAMGASVGGRLQIDSLTLQGSGSTTAGISFVGTAGQFGFRWMKFADLQINTMSTQGINLVAADMANGVSFHTEISRCEINSTGNGNPTGRGIAVTNATLLKLDNNEINSSGREAILLTNCLHASLINNSLSSNNSTPTLKGQTFAANSQVQLLSCHNFTIRGLDIENINPSLISDPNLIQCGLALRGCWGGAIDGMNMAYPSDDPSNYPSYAIAYLEGTRGVRRGTVLTSFMRENPIFFDRFSPHDLQASSDRVLNFTRALAADGLQT